MCGILGISVLNESINKNAFIEALDMLTHRGPDSSGIWFGDSNENALGFKRLSIIDLSSNANQPMQSSCGNYNIVFNGEIYNFVKIRNTLLNKGYEFNSASDSEVLLNAYIEWGVRCLNKVDGMFAFAIHDAKDKLIFAARDLAGQKPLYYSYDQGSLIFASEIKPIILLKSENKEINKSSIYNYFNKGYIPQSQTAFQGIHKLPPSQYMVFDLLSRNIKLTPYYDLVSQATKINNGKLIDNSDEATQRLDKLFNESVNNSLISDVPLGVLLSGGLDSSLVAAYASKNKSNLRTFSVIFPDNAEYNEQIHARRVADYLKTNHIEINADEVSPKIIEDLAYFYDEPFSDPSMIPTFLLSQAVKKHCSVVLGGDGGDELFGGYPSYEKKLKFQKVSKIIPYYFRKPFSSLIKKFIPTDIRGFSYINTFGDDFNNAFTSFEPLFYPSDIRNLFKNELFLSDRSFNSDREFFLIKDFLTRISVGDFCSFLSEDILVKVDRASMAHSLEVRSPFLSKDIIDFAFLQLHPSLKIKDGNKKIILKLLGKSVLPKNFEYDRKKGFSFPLGNLLMQENWNYFFRKKIENFNSDILNKTFALRLLNKHSATYSNERKLFAIIQFICWYEKHLLKIS